jgi:hypothetical protein
VREKRDAEEASKDTARQARLSAQLSGSALPALWLELEGVGSGSAQHVDGEPLLQGRPPAAAAAESRLSIDGEALLLCGLSCPARLPLRVFLLADLARIAQLSHQRAIEKGSKSWRIAPHC